MVSKKHFYPIQESRLPRVDRGHTHRVLNMSFEFRDQICSVIKQPY